jgi:hypothetical protein
VLNELSREHMKTREDVIATIRDLLTDLKTNPENWENSSLDRYLDSMAGWLEGAGKKYNQPPSWELVIDMLEAARIYE